MTRDYDEALESFGGLRGLRDRLQNAESCARKQPSPWGNLIYIVMSPAQRSAWVRLLDALADEVDHG